MDRKNLLKRLAYLIFFIFIVHFLATKFYWYYTIAYLDMVMHFLGGFWLGLAGVYLFQPKNYSMNVVLKILFFVLAIGAGWEAYQILVNEVLAKNPFDYLDISSDIFLDLFGGFCAILYVLYSFKNKWVVGKE